MTPTTTPSTPCSQLFSVSGLVFALWHNYSYAFQDYYMTTHDITWATDEFNCTTQCGSYSDCIFWTYIAPASAWGSGCWMWSQCSELRLMKPSRQGQSGLR